MTEVSLIKMALSVMKDITFEEILLIDGYIRQIETVASETLEGILCLLHLFHHIPVESIMQVYGNNYTMQFSLKKG